jgi:predicted outer membrane repeat protein
MHLGLGESSAAAGVCLPQNEALPTLVALRNGCVFTGNMAQQQGGALAVQSGVLVAQARTHPSRDRRRMSNLRTQPNLTH